MAMKDFQSIQVAPGNEDEAVRLWMSFGWELKNKQRVQTPIGVDHFELTFERDPERKNYAELKSLEERYYTTTPPSSSSGSPPKRFGCLFSILIVLSLFLGLAMLIGSLGDGISGEMGMLAFSSILTGVLIIVFRIRSYPKRLQPWTEACDAYEKANDAYIKEHSEILERARSLV
jgi:hypothetical protein